MEASIVPVLATSGDLLSSLAHLESTDDLLALSSAAVALVGGYFGWIFAGAAFVCADGEFEP
ncbi:MAG: hypothetical protein ACLFVJ_17100 [Persicimonas sp.]